MTEHHLAQLNVARMRGPLESPLMAAFVASLEAINRLAEESAGFVWRLQTEAGDATSLRPLGDELLVNVSVWITPEALTAFVYRSAHASLMKRRREWFDPLAEAHTVLWWVPCGHRPTVDEALERLAELREHGPTPRAFTFRDAYAANSVRRS